MLVLALVVVPVVSAGAASRATLKISPTTVEYGGAISIVGRIPTGQAHRSVALWAHSCHFTTATAIRTLVTRKRGVFSFRIGPTLRTTYFVVWGEGSRSRQITVGVSPQIRLEKGRLGGYYITVLAGNGGSFQGKHALLQRLEGKRWHTIGRAVLKLTSSPEDLTAVSGGKVNLHVKTGALLRAVLPLSQARPCYKAATSGLLHS